MPDPTRRRLGLRAVGAFVWLLAASAAHGQADMETPPKPLPPSPEHPVVAGFERFGSDPKTDAVGMGLLLLGDLNCVSCHRPKPTLDARVARKQAPALDEVGARIRSSYLKAFLADPAGVKPGTTMPDVFAGRPAEEKAGAVEALSHLLASTGRVKSGRSNRKLIEEGQALYTRVGCATCHGPREGKTADGGTTVPLGNLAAKYTVTSLAAFLRDPLKVRPSGRMPAPLISPQESIALAQFLAKDPNEKPRPNLEYKYYEGEWEKLPDFATLAPVSEGQAEGFDLSVAKRVDKMGLRFQGFLKVDRDGEYTFHLQSDDGSKLFIDDQLVTNNDGIHGPQEISGKATLKQGSHRLAAEVFNLGSGVELEVAIEGPRLRRQPVEGFLSLKPEGPEKEETGETFEVDPSLVEKGRDLFARVGCASCHALKSADTLVASTLEAPGLDALAPRGGCLDATPETLKAKRVPAYPLSQAQKSVLTSALAAATDLASRPPAPREIVARDLTAFNCYACHQRDGVGGVEPPRNAFFETTQKEMGDEGRIPPHLNGVAAKLKADFLKDIAANGAKDRPYMLTRMPKFGEANLGPLLEALAALDHVEAVPLPEFSESERKVKSFGRFLAGGEALGCIKCHTFKGIEAEGIQAIDMTRMTRRLNHDWFHRYVVDPAVYRPGTRMPTGWPDGKSMLPKVLDGNATKQVEAVWRFLSDGFGAAEPYGLGREPMPLFVTNEAVVYRNFIQGGGPRAIAVGYPEKANLAFDANDLRLALIWQGGFIDASRHWTGRGEGFQPPMGENVVSLPAGAPFAALSSLTIPWPSQSAKELGYKFRGYRLGKDQRPTFLYDLGATHVEDRPDGVAGKPSPGLERTLTLASEAPADDLWLRVAVADKVKPLEGGWFLVNGEWKVKVEAEGKPIVRSSKGKDELLVPVQFKANTATIVERFEW